jgi:hypothetical protein
MDITVRQQVLRDGAWTALLVPKVKRPSLPWRERMELQQQLSNQLRLELQTRVPANPTPTDQGATTMRRALDATTLQGILGTRGTGTLSYAAGYGLRYDFDEGPQSCIEALGEYRVEPNGFALSFVTPLPGDLNMFVLERTDLDANRSRLHLTRGDCRWELTIGQSLRPQRDTRWVALPLAPLRH